MPIGAWRLHWHHVPTSSPVLSTCQGGQEPGPAAQRWHPTLLALCPAGAGTGNRLALPWDCVEWRGGCKGSISQCLMPQVRVGATGQCWTVLGDAGARGWGVSQRQHQLRWLRASLSQQDSAQLKASDELFDCGELCQFPSLHPAESKVPATGTPVCRVGTPRLPWEQMGTLCPPSGAHSSLVKAGAISSNYGFNYLLPGRRPSAGKVRGNLSC